MFETLNFNSEYKKKLMSAQTLGCLNKDLWGLAQILRVL